MRRVIQGVLVAVDLYSHGCIVICTPECLQRPLIRTTIQPDADVINVLAPKALEKSELLTVHLKKIENKLLDLRCFRQFWTQFWFLLNTVILACGLSYLSHIFVGVVLDALGLGIAYLIEWFGKSRLLNILWSCVSLGLSLLSGASQNNLISIGLVLLVQMVPFLIVIYIHRKIENRFRSV